MNNAGQVNLRSIFGHHVEGSCVFAEFSPQSKGRFRGKVVVADPLLGTPPLKNASELSGNIALILRGSGADAKKARTAEECGAIGVIFGNTGETSPAKSDGKEVGIPCVIVEKIIYDQVLSQNMLDPLAWFADVERRSSGTIASAGGIKQALAEGQVLTLEVTVLRGKDLNRAQSMGKLDPYVEMAVGDQVRRTKTDRDGGQNPTWNQKLKFKLDKDRLAAGVSMRCLDEETLKASELIGAVPLDLEAALLSGSASLQVGIVNEFGIKAGTLHVTLLIKDRARRYKPASAMQGRGVLEVQVVRGEGLYSPPNSTGFDKPSPFCKVKLGGECKRTRAHLHGARDPVWGERLAMTLPSAADAVERRELEVEVWEQRGEREGGGGGGGGGGGAQSELIGTSQPLDVIELLGSKGSWEGSLDLKHPQEAGAGKVHVQLKMLTPPSTADAATDPSSSRASSHRNRHPTRIDPMVSLFLMMTAMLLLVVPVLRAACLRLIPAMLLTLLVCALLLAGIIWVKSKTLLADIIKGTLGAVANLGELVESYDGHRAFASTVSLSNLPLSTLVSFFATGTLTVQQLVLPNALSFTPSSVFAGPAAPKESNARRTMLKAQSASLQVALASLFSPVVVVQRVVLRQCELHIDIDDAMRSNIQAVLQDAAAFCHAAGRVFGQPQVTARQILFKGGTLHVRSPTLGAEELVVPVGTIELDGATSRAAGEEGGGMSAVKRLVYKLIQAAHEAKKTGGEVELQVHCDLDKELEEEGSDSEEEGVRGPVFDASQFATMRGGNGGGVNQGGVEEEEDDDTYIAY